MTFQPVLALTSVRHSYWFWPSIMVVAALVAGVAIPLVDAALGTKWWDETVPLPPARPDAARATLTTLASALIGVAGVAFSVTIVAVSFASSNFGPRLIGNFMGDRINQLVLGVFVATFVYCMMVLRAVESGGDAPVFVPQIALLTANLLALGCVGALIMFIHHVPESINVTNLVSSIGERLTKEIADVHAGEHDGPDPLIAPMPPASRVATAHVEAATAGHIQYIDVKVLRERARELGARITVLRRPGDFVVRGERLLAVEGAKPAEEGELAALRRTISLGRNRTELQDASFLSDQLVEIVGRALSPGINDPHTAMLCLDWLRSALTVYAKHPPRPAEPNDAAVRIARITFEDLLARSFSRMRPYVGSDRTVTLHAIAVLADIARAASTPSRADAALNEMRNLAAAATHSQTDPIVHDEVGKALAAATDDVQRAP